MDHSALGLRVITKKKKYISGRRKTGTPPSQARLERGGEVVGGMSGSRVVAGGASGVANVEFNTLRKPRRYSW